MGIVCIFILYRCLIFSINNVRADIQFECANTNIRETRGRYFETKKEQFYTASPTFTYSNTTSEKCIMFFLTEPKYLSMNIEGSDDKEKCHMFVQKESEDHVIEGILIKIQQSTYYEKQGEFTEGATSIIDVEAKDDKPGTFVFIQPTGKYQVKLNHVQGGTICSFQNHKTPFGCFWGTDPIEGSAMTFELLENFRGQVVLGSDSFDKFEGVDGYSTRYIASCRCIHFIEGKMYSFWHSDDLEDAGENDNSGKSSFHFLVNPCS